MYEVALFVFYFAVCAADLPVAPPAPPRVYCSDIPAQILECMGRPSITPIDNLAKCTRSTTACERLTCSFRQSGWLDGAQVDKVKVTEHFERFARDAPEWSAAVQQIKTVCLAGELPAQGIFLNCPAYDIWHCAFSAFIKHAQPSQWFKSQSCDYPRQYAAACPVCPDECFAPAIPVGSCNACIVLPRTP
uniref:Odorant-binding protein 7 n=1 Tax=Heortia vitessoides TaxID=1557813 RepID=A0A978W7A0_9NEOP|nr:odorant-binding protein 7 [Heortia vitessoides]